MFSRYSTAGKRERQIALSEERAARADASILTADILQRAKSIFERAPIVLSTVLRIKAYAHDRITISCGRNLAMGNGRGRKSQEVVRLQTAGRGLDIQRESQRGIKIGGRWRKMPMATEWTTRARNWVMDAAHIVEHYGKGTGLFVTLTYPGGTDDGYKCMAMASGYVVNRLNRWLQSRIVDDLSVHVWELQKRGAPHLHYLFRVAAGVDVSALQADIRCEWRKILEDVSDETGIDLFKRACSGTWRGNQSLPVVDVRELRYTYAQYISKYASKSASKRGVCSVFRPGRWYGISAKARLLARARRIDVQVGFAPSENIDAIFGEAVARLTAHLPRVWSRRKADDEIITFVSAQAAPGAAKAIAEEVCQSIYDFVQAYLFNVESRVFVPVFNSS